jgi:hypothetical protein
MFWDIPDLWPVWLSGAFSQRKITANSGRWEAKVVFDRPYLAIREQNTAMGGWFCRVCEGIMPGADLFYEIRIRYSAVKVNYPEFF